MNVVTNLAGRHCEITDKGKISEYEIVAVSYDAGHESVTFALLLVSLEDGSLSTYLMPERETLLRILPDDGEENSDE